MRRYTITIIPSKINLFPANELEEIFQNVTTIVTTAINTIPLFRSFGVDQSYIDSPTPVMQARAVADITTAIEQFEPRVIVESIGFEPSELIQGQVKPVITISIREEVEL